VHYIRHYTICITHNYHILYQSVSQVQEQHNVLLYFHFYYPRRKGFQSVRNIKQSLPDKSCIHIPLSKSYNKYEQNTTSCYLLLLIRKLKSYSKIMWPVGKFCYRQQTHLRGLKNTHKCILHKLPPHHLRHSLH
jgi:hypothetical protein